MRIQLNSGTPAEVAIASGELTQGLVIVPDIGGLRPLFDDMCARLAAEHDWSVIVVEPFPGEETMPIEQRLERGVSSRSDQRLLGDLVAAADRLGTPRVAVMGFCMGGMYALKAAGASRFDRAVSFYGMIRIPDRFRGPGHVEPLEYLARPASCPVLALLGGRDEFTPPADMEALRSIDRVEVVVYPEAEHGFVHDPARPTHRPADAADAWRRAVAFIEGGD